MKYEVVIQKHWQGKKYNVDLVSWQGNEGLGFYKAFKVSKKQAEKEALYNAELYGCPITRKF